MTIAYLFILVNLFFIESINSFCRKEFEISWFKGNPDGVPRQILGINKQSPGPLIRVKKGENVEIIMKNKIPNAVTDIHCHGLFQKGTLTSDGVGGVTQCDTLFGKSYKYSFTADQPGTFWYHSHSGLQLVDGHKGPLIIDDPNDYYLRPFNTYLSKKYIKECQDDSGKAEKKLFYVDHSTIDYDNQPDAVIQLTDWNHQTADELSKIFFSPESDGNEPTPDSALINGIGNYYCKVPDCKPQYNTKIVAGKAKRFRIINMSAMAVFHFSIDKHKMFIIETDGITLDGKTEVDVIRINSGQRYSVIVKADREPKNYWIRAIMDKNIYPSPPADTWNPNVFGILSYSNNKGRRFSKEIPCKKDFFAMDSLFEKSFEEGKAFIDMKVPLVPLHKYYKLPPTVATKTFTLNVTPLQGSNMVNYLGFNNIQYAMMSDTTLLGKILKHVPYDQTEVVNGLQQGYNPFKFEKGDVVDLIINNLDGMEHPMHGHGHAFYVMYNGDTDSKGFITDNINPFPYDPNASLRDTASVNGSAVLVLRFVADNPGLWVFHCHIAWHLDAGLMATLVEDESKVRRLYSKFTNKVTNCPIYSNGSGMQM